MEEIEINVEGVSINKEIADKIVRKVLIRESKNIKTQEKSGTTMSKEIKKMIEEEVECY